MKPEKTITSKNTYCEITIFSDKKSFFRYKKTAKGKEYIFACTLVLQNLLLFIVYYRYNSRFGALPDLKFASKSLMIIFITIF
ncbi:hypothetical protein HW49_03435 [Porphyromonadaceae bacterium COT-184 OH4590]|nr:hypothetical protein HW49_03435 [Porphyromonadaceae bacterium COT-184 OH4590]